MSFKILTVTVCLLIALSASGILYQMAFTQQEAPILKSTVVPRLAFPDRFSIELFADFSGLEGDPKVFQLTITDGSNGFPKGMYVTSGPVGGDRLFHVNEQGNITVVKAGFNSTETILFATERYGEGMFVTDTTSLQILRLLPDGSISTFANVGTPPFGPAAMTYGADGLLYLTDFSGGNILRVNPDGNTEVFTSLPKPPAGVGGIKPVLFDETSLFVQDGFITATFNFVPAEEEPSHLGNIYSISSDGTNITQLAGGLDGIELLTFGPGGSFGSDLFVASMGTDGNHDGNVFTISPQGDLGTFMTDIDATHVIFDTQNVLGGGMFVADINTSGEIQELTPERSGGPAGKIWRIVPTTQGESGATEDTQTPGMIGPDIGTTAPTEESPTANRTEPDDTGGGFFGGEPEAPEQQGGGEAITGSDDRPAGAGEDGGGFFG